MAASTSRLAGIAARGIRTISDGDALLAPSITHRLIEEFATARTPITPPPGVRDRVQAVVLAYETGLVKPGHAN